MDVAYKSFTTDEDLLRAIQRNDRKALNHLYDAHFETVKFFVLRNSGDEDDARDVFQEGVIALWTNIRDGSYELRDDAKLSTYLVKICKYRWYEHLKSAGFQKTSKLEPEFNRVEERTFFDRLIREEEIDYMQGLFNRLGKQCRRILRMFYYEDKSMEVIAEAFSIQENSAKNQKYRCMKRLKELHQKYSQNQ